MSTPDVTQRRISRARKSPSETSFSMRVSRQALDLVDAAAAVVGKSRTEFVLDCTRRQAIDVLLDQRLFLLDDAHHDAFMRVLDAPPAPSARLKQLMDQPDPWEK